jgi:hypothetical protein
LFRIAIPLARPLRQPQLLGTASVGLSSVGHRQVGLLTPQEAAEKSYSLVAAEERIFEM